MTIALSRLVGPTAALTAEQGNIVVMGITSDSRAVQPGFVFAALPGTKVNGAAYVAQAIHQGAVAIIAPRDVVVQGAIKIASDIPQKDLAQMAARFYGEQPETIVAVTGTNGKTSVTVFVRQIWERMGFRAASLGTIGVVGPQGSTYLSHTTPDPVKLAELAASLRSDHVKHLAVEASSHGLAQYRLDGLQITAAAFTNLTRDHLDYHKTFEDYFDAKMRLFDELLPHDSPAVINADSPHAIQVKARAEARGLRVLEVGRSGRHIKLLEARPEGLEQHLKLESISGIHNVTLPLVGDFQASNALVAAGLVIACGGDEIQTFHALESLVGATGRLDLVGRKGNGAPVFVDYAHTPDALENAIVALKPYATGRLHVVFGCGGDRDSGKRPMMGEIAARLAERVYITDDNPRSEEPSRIRREILVAAKGAVEFADRAEAIRTAVDDMNAGDILLVAGKGHEPGQIYGTIVKPFSDHDAVRAALRQEAYHA